MNEREMQLDSLVKNPAERELFRASNIGRCAECDELVALARFEDGPFWPGCMQRLAEGYADIMGTEDDLENAECIGVCVSCPNFRPISRGE